MLHKKSGRKLSRKKKVRKALLRSLATALVLNNGIKTTVVKAKVLRPYVEKMITVSKNRTPLEAKRHLKAKLYDKKAVMRVLKKFSKRYKDRKGGYLRIIKLGTRDGDLAKMARIEFV
ncbi:MAG: 50S ribosomal protein L17 [uncultured bacterium]|nr:MAG: 50S ribosomal protein L17 [uncultured bacterium]